MRNFLKKQQRTFSFYTIYCKCGLYDLKYANVDKFLKVFSSPLVFKVLNIYKKKTLHLSLFCFYLKENSTTSQHFQKTHSRKKKMKCFFEQENKIFLLLFKCELNALVTENLFVPK